MSIESSFSSRLFRVLLSQLFVAVSARSVNLLEVDVHRKWLFSRLTGLDILIKYCREDRMPRSFGSTAVNVHSSGFHGQIPLVQKLFGDGDVKNFDTNIVMMLCSKLEWVPDQPPSS
uniref:Secreted protein n=1 Tax=Bursaphelenchus xylophilus TaxID=6326 RepID=A0A1I7SI06_BURXY